MERRCDFCKELAIYDAKTIMGPWAYLCGYHFKKYGIRYAGMFKLLESSEIKICIDCSMEKPIAEFYVQRKPSGLYYRPECKQCSLLRKKRSDMYKSKGGKD